MAEICQSIYAWEFRTVGETMDHRTVQLFEGQQFHVMSCVTAGSPCDTVPGMYVITK